MNTIKAGKAGKKVTRHNHLFRGLFRCGLCAGPLSPERQKGRVYYRCQTAACPTKTIREDQVESAVTERLGQLALGPEEIAETKRQLLDWLERQDQDQWQRSITLRLDQARQRLNRLTDLLIDGTISKDDFENRKQGLLLEIAELGEEERKAATDHLSAADIESFLELATSLHLQYEIATSDEKRAMVQNCFSNRILTPEKLELAPQEWLLELKYGVAVPDGDPERHTSRTLKQMIRKLEHVLGKGEDPETCEM